jgi:hypothetical protein
MGKRIVNGLFFSIVFLSGVVVGSVNTPEIISYAKALDDSDRLEQREMLKKNKPLPARLKKSKRIV